MIEVVYCNIEKYRNCNWQEMLEQIPTGLKEEVLRYKRQEDRLSRLLARIIIQDFLASKGYAPGVLEHFKRDEHHRPYLPIAEHFSISHSGNYVLVAFSDQPVGVDIEKKEPIDWLEYNNYFHKEESEHLGECSDPLSVFYELWSKKEAALKMLGKGIVDGLDGFSCTREHFSYKHSQGWFYKLPLNEEYVAYVSSSLKCEDVNVCFRLFEWNVGKM